MPLFAEVDKSLATRDTFHMLLSIYGKSHDVLWTNVGLLTFAIIFFIGGALRIVEFEGVGLSKSTKRILVTIHIFGLLCFSLALGLLATDIEQLYNEETRAFFIAGFFTLAPLHIYLAIKRKIHGRERA